MGTPPAMLRSGGVGLRFHRGELVAARVAKLEAAAAGEAKDRAQDDAAGRFDGGERRLEIVDLDHRQRRAGRLGRIALQADVGVILAGLRFLTLLATARPNMSAIT